MPGRYLNVHEFEDSNSESLFDIKHAGQTQSLSLKFGVLLSAS